MVLSYWKDISLVCILTLTMLHHEQVINVGISFENCQKLLRFKKKKKEEKEKTGFKSGSVCQMQ